MDWTVLIDCVIGIIRAILPLRQREVPAVSVGACQSFVMIRNCSEAPIHELVISSISGVPYREPASLEEAFHQLRDYPAPYEDDGRKISRPEYRVRVKYVPPGVYLVERPEAEYRSDERVSYEALFSDDSGTLWIKPWKKPMHRVYFGRRNYYAASSLPMRYVKARQIS